MAASTTNGATITEAVTMLEATIAANTTRGSAANATATEAVTTPAATTAAAAQSATAVEHQQTNAVSDNRSSHTFRTHVSKYEKHVPVAGPQLNHY